MSFRAAHPHLHRILRYFIFGALYLSGAYAWYRRGTTSRARILCYHRVPRHCRDRLLDVSVSKFKSQMAYLARVHRIVTLASLVERLRGGMSLLPGSCVVTFDDGTEDWYSIVLPILNKMKIPATFFTTTGYIGKKKISYPNKHVTARGITRVQLTKLAASPWATIGGHTKSHPKLSALNTADARREINISREKLSLYSKTPITIFAYPFGNAQDFSFITKRIVQEEGFIGACSLEERTVRTNDDPYELPRLAIFDEPLWMFKVRVSGILDDITSFFSRIFSLRRISWKPLPPTSSVLPALPPTPLVSVIATVFNQEKTVVQMIRNVCEQTYTKFELLILDDASIDRTARVIQTYCKSLPEAQRKKIRYLRHSHNLGLQANLNAGLRHAKGKLIARIDGDDIWTDCEKLQKQVHFLRTHLYHAITGGGLIEERDDGSIVKYFKPEHDREIRNFCCIENPFWHGAVMFRKDALAHMQYDAQCTRSEDYDLWLRIGTHWKMYNFPTIFMTHHDFTHGMHVKRRVRELRETIALTCRHRHQYPGFAKGLVKRCLDLALLVLPTSWRRNLARSIGYDMIKKRLFFKNA